MATYHQHNFYAFAESPFIAFDKGCRHQTPRRIASAFIKQRSMSDCGICCTAMLLGITYEEAYTLCLPFTNRPRDDIDFIKLPLLFSCARKKTHLLMCEPNELTNDGLCEITYERNNRQHWHYIVWDSKRQMYLDPQNELAHHFLIHRFLELGFSDCNSQKIN